MLQKSFRTFSPEDVEIQIFVPNLAHYSPTVDTNPSCQKAAGLAGVAVATN